MTEREWIVQAVDLLKRLRAPAFACATRLEPEIGALLRSLDSVDEPPPPALPAHLQPVETPAPKKRERKKAPRAEVNEPADDVVLPLTPLIAPLDLQALQKRLIDYESREARSIAATVMDDVGYRSTK